MSNEDFDIKLGQSVRRHIESKLSPINEPGMVAIAYGDPGTDQPPVFVAEKVMRSVEDHVRRHTDREVGGVLLGGFARNDKDSFIQITDFIEAKNTKETDVSLTFTHETWEQISAEQAQRGQDAQIVGWYHSHPGLGVFLSKDDEFIHQGFFTDPWHVAMVVDPIYHNWGCFKWNDGVLERTGGFYIFGEKKASKRIRDYVKTLTASRQAAPVSASSKADRTSMGSSKPSSFVWAAIVVLLLLQALTGYLLFRQRTAANDQDYYAKAQDLLSVSDIGSGISYLKQELINHPNDQRAFRELQRLNAALSDPSVSSSNDRMDEVNLMLHAAELTVRERPDPQSLDSDDASVQMAPSDPIKAALDVYEKAAASRPARLRRAVLLSKLIEDKCSGSASEGAKMMREKNSCYAAAVRWLQEEQLRQIAYGLSANQQSYSTAYAKLSEADKQVVKRLRAGLMKGKQ